MDYDEPLRPLFRPNVLLHHTCSGEEYVLSYGEITGSTTAQSHSCREVLITTLVRRTLVCRTRPLYHDKRRRRHST